MCQYHFYSIAVYRFFWTPFGFSSLKFLIIVVLNSNELDLKHFASTIRKKSHYNMTHQNSIGLTFFHLWKTATAPCPLQSIHYSSNMYIAAAHFCLVLFYRFSRIIWLVSMCHMESALNIHKSSIHMPPIKKDDCNTSNLSIFMLTHRAGWDSNIRWLKTA